MQIGRWLGRYRRLFDLRRPVRLHLVDVSDAEYGAFYPGIREDLILINREYAETEEQVRGALLHKLIHAEQHGLGLPLDHDAYFNRRAAELKATTGIDP
jgi:hypothetical protein